MLANIKYWETVGQKNGFAIPHFNVWNAEMLMGVIDAAEETKAPIIISFGTGFIQNTIFEEFAPMMVSMAKNASVPVITHWDHGRSMDIVKNAYNYGMNSVMRDASALPFEENIKEIQSVVDYFHPLGIPVEAELGHVGNETIYEEALAQYQYTDPNQAKEFVDRTGCDSLAVAIGNVHGVYSAKPKIAFDVLEKVRNVVDVPLVLHGASCIPDDDVKKAVTLGVAKVNIHTELGLAAMDAIRENVDKPFLEVEQYVRKAVKQRAIEKILLLGDDGKASYWKK
ncbi:class II fructose-bisphosphate aldolase [Loigolactobacillus coryniformis]|uniref:Class II fructose-bisphosphate aldolase n=1 Tax=Loigolactobacillus coryniformis TaxID=1610 RepID=A0A5B8TE28_9LACO|nr:ketose-bisphosphate aldolase [Loigolactobacillus coryniformis]QEA52580.1 class II fructose-bisphosphate aldolase [Loigolactobacillus coryniformis]